MSFHIKEDIFLPNPDPCDQDPIHLNQENIRIFGDQQKLNYFAPNGYVSPLEFGNQWSPNGVNGLGMGQPYAMNSDYHESATSDDMGSNHAAILMEKSSISSVSLPTYGGQGNVFPGGAIMAGDASSGTKGDFSPNGDPSNKKTKPKKQFLSDLEMLLMDKQDSQLSEQELTIKKKAQNRLAQRAFRERKEFKLKELENKLLQSEEERQKLLEKLDEIKLQFISVRTENRFLRSTEPSSGPRGFGGAVESSSFVFPQSQQEFISEMVGETNHNVNQETINKVYEEPQNPGRKVLAIGAVWDYLQIKAEEEEFENVDMMEVMSLLKGNEACHGYGPAYPLDMVESALCQVAGYH